MDLGHVPTPPAVLIGREAELRRLQDGLRRVPVGLVCGVPGVGKSALASACAATYAEPVLYSRATDDELDALIDDALRRLSPEPYFLNDRRARCTELARRLDAAAALWVVDDLHRLSEAAQRQLLREVGFRLRHGRLLATSRELAPLGSEDPDYLEVRLPVLGEASARALWLALDDLYGQADGFDAAWLRSRGNPLRLRSAHAGQLDDDDPVTSTVRRLDADERRLAAALALSNVRLPRDTLFALLPDDLGRAAFRRLLARLVADTDGAGDCGLHDLYAEAVRAALGDDERRALHEALAEALAGPAKLEPVARVREACRHLRALAAWDPAWLRRCGDFLVEHAPRLFREGAAGELLRLFDAIPAPARSPAARIAHVRTLARTLHLGRARDELDAMVGELVAAAAEPPAELLGNLAQIRMLTGDLGGSVALLEQQLGRGGVRGDLRHRLVVSLAIGYMHLDRGGEARALLAAESASAGALEAHATFEACRAFLLLAEEHDDGLEVAARRALSLFEQTLPSHRGSVQVKGIAAAAFARIGRRDDALALYRSVAPALDNREDFLSLVDRKMLGAVFHFGRGERAAARTYLEEMDQMCSAGGYLLGALFARSWLGRLLLLVGRRREARALLDEAEAEAERIGAIVLARSVRHAREVDPTAWVRRRAAERARAPGRPGLWSETRLRAIDALALASEGNARDARAVLAELDGALDQPGYGLDRAFAALARSLLARLDNRPAAAVEARREAEQAIEREGLDDDLVTAALEALDRGVRSPSPAEPAPAPGDADDLLLDGRAHRLRAGVREVSLEGRPALQKLLYALARRPNACLSKAELVRSLWSLPYSKKHDTPLRVNVQRLRSVLKGTPLAIDLTDEGYRLSAPPEFRFVDDLT